jgi:hypothetical protein
MMPPELLSVPWLVIVPPWLVSIPLLMMVPVLINTIPELIISESPELIVKDDTVHVVVPLHVPPIATHEDPLERVVVVACASGIANEDNVKIKTAKIDR